MSSVAVGHALLPGPARLGLPGKLRLCVTRGGSRVSLGAGAELRSPLPVPCLRRLPLSCPKARSAVLQAAPPAALTPPHVPGVRRHPSHRCSKKCVFNGKRFVF